MPPDCDEGGRIEGESESEQRRCKMLFSGKRALTLFLSPPLASFRGVRNAVCTYAAFSLWSQHDYYWVSPVTNCFSVNSNMVSTRHNA